MISQYMPVGSLHTVLHQGTGLVDNNHQNHHRDHFQWYFNCDVEIIPLKQIWPLVYSLSHLQTCCGHSNSYSVCNWHCQGHGFHPQVAMVLMKILVKIVTTPIWYICMVYGISNMNHNFSLDRQLPRLYLSSKHIMIDCVSDDELVARSMS